MKERLNNLREQVVQLHGNYTKILPINLEMVEVAKNGFGINSVEYAVALNDLGGVYRHLGRYLESEKAFQEAMDILANQVGTSDPNYATALNNMAGLLRLMHQYDQSEKYFQSVINIYKNSLGEEHFLTLSALNNLGLLYQDMQRYEEARVLHEKCLKSLIKQEEHPIAYGTTLNNLANLFEKMGNLEQATELMGAVVALYKKNVGEEHPLYANALNNYASLFFKKGDLSQAQTLFSQAKDINLKMFGVDSSVYKVSADNLNLITQKLNNHIPSSTTVTSLAKEHTPIRFNDQIDAYGMNLCRRYFNELCFPVLAKVFPDKINRMAIGLVGEGSECYGFDDVTSQDHDFGPRIMVWLTQSDFAEFGDKVVHTLNHIPKDFDNTFLPQANTWQEANQSIFIIEDFFAKYTGLFHPPQTYQQWRAIPEHHLSTATNGQVFFDPLGQFTQYRKTLLDFYPDDIRLKKMAARCMLIAQAGQYNLTRCLKRNEYVAATMASSEFIDAGISLVFLINRQYKPFYKWMHRSLKELPILGAFSYQLFNDFVLAPETEKAILIEQFCAEIIKYLTQNHLTDSNSDFLLDHGPSIMKRIQDKKLQESNPWIE